MTKAPTPRDKSKKQHDQKKTATKNLDYTTNADGLMTVSWSNSSHPNSVVKPKQGYHLPQIFDVPVGYNSHKQLRGRLFDSEGGLALLGNKYSDLENAGNK